jgi:hypothetical protein
MANFEELLQGREVELDGIVMNDMSKTETSNTLNTADEITTGDDSPQTTYTQCTLESERRRFRKEDESFWDNYNRLVSCIHNNDEEFLETINSMATEKLEEQRDHLKRSLLHIAIEKSNNQLAKSLIFSGFNVHTKEGCGLTPLHLAIISENSSMAHFLIERNARFNGPMFSSIPSPQAVAEKLHQTDILDAMCTKDDESDEENDLIAIIDRTMCKQTEVVPDDEHAVGRKAAGFVTHVVGDVGTCKTNNAVKARSCSFDWMGICVGDMHNKGYLSEACFKEHGQSGLHHIVHDVLKRKKLTAEAFKSRKFQENFRKISCYKYEKQTVMCALGTVWLLVLNLVSQDFFLQIQNVHNQ